jgi:hypothetical protein
MPTVVRSTHADHRAEHACRPSCGARMPTVVRSTQADRRAEHAPVTGVEEDQPTARPSLVQLPGRVPWARDVVAAMDEYARDRGETVHAG